MHFLDFTNSRLTVSFRPLTIGDEIALCELPAHLREAYLTELLRRIVADSSRPMEQWTLQERYAVFAHYLMALSRGNLVIGSTPYSALQVPVDYVEPAEFEHGGNTLVVHHLTQEHLHALEQVAFSGRIASGSAQAMRASWRIGAMAASIRRKGAEGEGDLVELISARAATLKSMDAKDFYTLEQDYRAACEKNIHLLNYWWDDEGALFLPVKQKAESEVGYHPIRFRPASVIDSRAHRLFQ